MSLSHKHIPFSCSLKDKVRETFSPRDTNDRSDFLSQEQLVAFLAKSKDTDNSPFATIKRRAAKESLRPDLRPGDQATLAWICEAFDEWEDHYPLEQPLKDQIRRLLPLAVAMGLKEDAFFTPGAHALHRLLDALQNGAVGWQMRLDRAGQMLEQRIQRAVEKALEWFNNDNIDIGAITQELLAANERDSARAQRMVQRLEETEEARLKTLSARRDAANDINAGLDEYELPAAIGEFLKGPWYDSAQLVLVKHGVRSREWEQMRRATLHLMESVQALDDSSDAARDRQEQILRRLPGELRRWLLSLEHDSDATDSAIGLVEYAHLRIQHGQKLQLVGIAPIPLEKEAHDEAARDDHTLANGDWYQFEDDDGELRAQLVLQLEDGQHLLFTNFVGLKALDLSRRAFVQRVNDGFSLLLPNRETFSLSLASAAGVDSEDRLRQLTDPSYGTSEDPQSTQPSEDPALPNDAPKVEQDAHPEPEQEQEQEQEPGQGQDADPDPDPDPEILVDPENNHTSETPTGEDRSETALEPGNTDNFDPILTPPEGAELEPTLDLDEPETPAETPQASAPSYTPQAPVAVEAPATPESPVAPSAENAPQQTLTSEPAPIPSAEPAPLPETLAPVASPPAPAPEPVPEPAPAPIPPPPPVANPTVQTPPEPSSPTPVTNEGAQTPTFEPPPAPASPPPVTPPSPEPRPAPPEPVPAPQETVSTPALTPVPAPETPASAEREVDVPMGAWLGFHDGETPIMAKLAVFDPRRDNYIFVNRKGIAMRELSRSELRALMDQGLVDILETRSYFRDEVERAREEGQ